MVAMVFAFARPIFGLLEYGEAGPRLPAVALDPAKTAFGHAKGERCAQAHLGLVPLPALPSKARAGRSHSGGNLSIGRSNTTVYWHVAR
jgi:hypothetical protein